MVVMALDHAREHFTSTQFDPTDFAHTTPALFLTRWITHFCAPVFVFLAGTSAYLSRGRGRTASQLARFLLTRGLWLAVLEVTVVRAAWFFDLDFSRFVLQVIWAIGMSMVVLSALVFLPTWAVGVFGVGMIATHNLLDAVPPERFGSLAWLWYVLHVPHIPVIYPLVPWIGVMAAGYALGPILRAEPTRRRRLLEWLGVGLTAAFIVLRTLNRYGDPRPWTTQATPVFTALSFLDATKYPPSLLYLLMTLGPAIALLPLLEGRTGALARALTVYGRVPLFYYVAHVALLHALAIVGAAVAGFDARAFFTICFLFPKEWGFSLPAAYAAWIGVVVVLYLPCRWFAGVKQRSQSVWLSYV